MRGLGYITRQSYEVSRNRVVFDVPPTRETGCHRMEGVLMASGVPIQRGASIRNAQIADMAPTILYLLGCPVPSDFDGHVLTEGLDPGYVADHPLETMTAEGTQGGSDPGTLSPEEEQDLAQRLRDLGYIG
jgi:hypothetical protein